MANVESVECLQKSSYISPEAHRSVVQWGMRHLSRLHVVDRECMELSAEKI